MVVIEMWVFLHGIDSFEGNTRGYEEDSTSYNTQDNSTRLSIQTLKSVCSKICKKERDIDQYKKNGRIRSIWVRKPSP
jgi:hypothetical protein